MSFAMDHLGRVHDLDGDADSAGPFEVVAEPVNVVIRWCGDDGQAHVYVLAHTMDPRRERLTPACEAGKRRPGSHVRRQVGTTDLVGPDRHDMCPACTVWTRHNPHTIKVAGRAA